MKFIPDSGFVSRGGRPNRDRPQDWVVWHFTHIDNISDIVAAGSIVCSNKVHPITDVANADVKGRRTSIRVTPDDNYPSSVVSDHVPFYIAAKSPMLFVVNRGHSTYSGGCDGIVMLGFVLGDLVDSGVLWCASDRNAASAVVEFSRTLSTLGSFVDFDLLCQREWYNTPDDPDRKSRRAAEILVMDHLDLAHISLVVAKVQATLDRARDALDDGVSGSRKYVLKPDLFY